MEDEDFFSDDDFANITDNALQALEHDALVSSTQRPKTATSAHANTGLTQPSKKQPHNASSLNRPGTRTGTGNLPWRPPQPKSSLQRGQLLSQAGHRAPPPSAPEQPTPEYGLDEETVVDLDEQPAGGHRSSAQPGRQSYKDHPDDETRAAFAAADAELGSQYLTRRDAPQTGSMQGLDVSGLRARIATLEAEQERLRRSEQEARALAQAKQGEIQIVRSKLDTSAKSYEGRIAAMQKQHADEVAKQKAELESGRRERAQIETDNRFLHHDLAQEADRVKRLNGAGRSRALTNGRAETPRKSKRMVSGLGDGFDDGEVQLVSPSRSKDRSREATPKAGLKRKRTAQDSPVALSFNQPARLIKNEDSLQSNTSFDSTTSRPAVKTRKADKFEYFQAIVDHRVLGGKDRTLEAFTHFSFPSQKEKTLASLLMDKISKHDSSDVEDFAIWIATILLEFWSVCLKEKYFQPFRLILNLLHFVLHSQLGHVSSGLNQQAIPLCIKTIDLVAVENVKILTYGPDYAASINWEAHTQLINDLDIDAVLDFLESLCQASEISPESSRIFWIFLEHTFMLLMLNKAQPIWQIMTTLSMLGSSALDTSFGVVVNDTQKQRKQENDVVDRLTNLLFEAPIPPKDETAYTAEEILELRIAVLRVFKKMCQHDHGGRLLAQHRSAIGRLVRFLDGQVSRLYTVLPAERLTGKSNDDEFDDKVAQRAHALLVQSINMTTRVLYHLLRTYDGSIDIVQKLRAVLGGYHKFLVSLSRIAFGEQLVFESGIEDAAAEAAHAILDRVLGPDDGEAVMKAVETPRSGGVGSSALRPERETSSSEVG